jgi:hypothetical protein
MDMYCEAPTILRYKVASSNFTPSNLLRVAEDDMGDLIGFASEMLARLRIS